MPPIIEIQNLGKQYKLAAAQPYLALRDLIGSSVKNILRSNKKTKETF